MKYAGFAMHKALLLLCLSAVMALITVSAIYLVGLRMGPPNDRRAACRYICDHCPDVSVDARTRLLNLDLLTRHEVLIFMKMECESVWYFVGENKSVSDSEMIRGYDLMTERGKNKFRNEWRYWGWGTSRQRLAAHVFGGARADPIGGVGAVE